MRAAPFIFGTVIEINTHRSSLLSHRDFSKFLTHPINGAFLAATAGLILTIVVPAIRRNKDEAVAKEE